MAINLVAQRTLLLALELNQMINQLLLLLANTSTYKLFKQPVLKQKATCVLVLVFLSVAENPVLMINTEPSY